MVLSEQNCPLVKKYVMFSHVDHQSAQRIPDHMLSKVTCNSFSLENVKFFFRVLLVLRTFSKFDSQSASALSFRTTKQADYDLDEYVPVCLLHRALTGLSSPSPLPPLQTSLAGANSSGTHGGNLMITISRHSWTKTNSFHTAVAGNQTVYML
jgi:hypothetical protein